MSYCVEESTQQVLAKLSRRSLSYCVEDRPNYRKQELVRLSGLGLSYHICLRQTRLPRGWSWSNCRGSGGVKVMVFEADQTIKKGLVELPRRRRSQSHCVWDRSNCQERFGQTVKVPTELLCWKLSNYHKLESIKLLIVVKINCQDWSSPNYHNS